MRLFNYRVVVFRTRETCCSWCGHIRGDVGLDLLPVEDHVGTFSGYVYDLSVVRRIGVSAALCVVGLYKAMGKSSMSSVCPSFWPQTLSFFPAADISIHASLPSPHRPSPSVAPHLCCT